MRAFATVFATLFICSAAFADLKDLDTFTYVSSDGGGSGAYEGDITAANPVTILDSEGGDIWNGGDQLAYLHHGARIPAGSSYTAKVRVISQTQAIDGRWGKAGIVSTASLEGSAATATTQVAFGNGSQTYVNNDGTISVGQSPVPVRLGGRTAALPPNSGFENGIKADAAYTGAVDGDGNVANVLEQRWLSLEYDAATNGFTAGVARANPDGTPGVWSYSDVKNDIAINDGGGHYVGLGYSAHNSLNFDQVARADKLHGVTFDSFELNVVPEPASFSILAFGVLGLLGLRRRNR